MVKAPSTSLPASEDAGAPTDGANDIAAAAACSSRDAGDVTTCDVPALEGAGVRSADSSTIAAIHSQAASANAAVARYARLRGDTQSPAFLSRLACVRYSVFGLGPNGDTRPKTRLVSSRWFAG